MELIERNFLWIFLIAALLASNTFTFKTKVDVEQELVEVNGKYYKLLEEKSDTTYIETFVVEEVEKIKYEKIFIEVPVKIIEKVDTTAILEEFYAVKMYTDTLDIKSDNEIVGQVEVVDKVTQNSIVNRKYTSYVRTKEVVIERIVEPLPTLEVYLGGYVSNHNTLAATISLKNKNESIVGLDLGTVLGGQTTDPYIGIRYMKKIW